MSHRLITRLKNLFALSRVSAYTGNAQADKPDFSTEPQTEPLSPFAEAAGDEWLFESAEAMQAETDRLAAEMNTLADGLTDLRETLALISGEAPFPLEATTLAPCNYDHTDADLFDGEAVLEATQQDTVVDGDDAYLFEEVRQEPSTRPALINHESDDARCAA